MNSTKISIESLVWAPSGARFDMLQWGWRWIRVDDVNKCTVLWGVPGGGVLVWRVFVFMYILVYFVPEASERSVGVLRRPTFSFVRKG